MGTNMARLLSHYWDRQHTVPKAGISLGKAFVTERGVTQGYLAYPMIFKIMVDVVVPTVLAEACGPQEAHHSLGWEAGEQNFVFYTEDGGIVVRDYI